jgi:hypothetical protein
MVEDRSTVAVRGSPTQSLGGVKPAVVEDPEMQVSSDMQEHRAKALLIHDDPGEVADLLPDMQASIGEAAPARAGDPLSCLDGLVDVDEIVQDAITRSSSTSSRKPAREEPA